MIYQQFVFVFFFRVERVDQVALKGGAVSGHGDFWLKINSSSPCHESYSVAAASNAPQVLFLRSCHWVIFSVCFLSMKTFVLPSCIPIAFTYPGRKFFFRPSQQLPRLRPGPLEGFLSSYEALQESSNLASCVASGATENQWRCQVCAASGRLELS